MKRKVILVIVAVIAIGFVAVLGKKFLDQNRNQIAWWVQAGAPDISDVMVTMPDGVRLATDVYFPGASGPRPTVLMRLPYGKRYYGEVRFWVGELTRRGFVVVAQDMRGRHGSEGIFAPYPNAGPDGVATLDWIINQPWSNGRVGTLGCSALGESQLMLAVQGHPALHAIVPIAAGGAVGSVDGKNAFFSAFEGGVFNLALSVGWFGAEGGKSAPVSSHRPIDPSPVLERLPVEGLVAKLRPDNTDYEAFLQNFENPQYWRDAGYITGDENFAVPALFIDTWHDPGIDSSLTLAKTLQASGASVKTIIGAGTHCNYLGTDDVTVVGDLTVSPDRHIGYVDLISQFLAWHLADGPAVDLPAYTYFTLVENKWREADSWPPAHAIQRQLFLSANQALVWEKSGISDFVHAFLSDPDNPVPSIGGPLCCTGNPEDREGPVFQNSIESRNDLLLFSSAPLENPVTIAGPIQAKLRISVSTPDSDLILRLTDVDTRGNSLLVQEGALRLRYRDSFQTPELLVPGEVYEVTVDMRQIAYKFDVGHQIRLHLAGSSFPRLSRNTNTGGPIYSETGFRVAEISVRSDSNAPSALILQILPD
ncbi:CocE/NonD family hydrolase [Ruegeria arenilitoris]|uniref:CocE/NonD family hydrolase n=1 Tax=Ruegeria arenilitoris TaxID=1173585 RepID=UPI00147D31E7|nr:CocE/NonD family hydrolase [Ruegeria arenilitoris]